MFIKNKVEKLQKRSSNIFNVFTSTVDQLKHVNNEIEVNKKARKSKINKLQREHDMLLSQQEQNDKLSGKITQFLNN